jgi:GNAT superfamily N-acetyltransferase
LDLTVFPPHQRVGNGKRLLDAVIAQGRELQRRRKTKLRRVWIGVEQKSQVIARAFLTSRGFHHITTVDELYRGQELMVYVKSMD